MEELYYGVSEVQTNSGGKYTICLFGDGKTGMSSCVSTDGKVSPIMRIKREGQDKGIFLSFSNLESLNKVIRNLESFRVCFEE